MEEGKKSRRRYFNISIAIKTTADTPFGSFASLGGFSHLTPNQGLSFKIRLLVKSIQDGSFDSYDLRLSHLTEYTPGGFYPKPGYYSSMTWIQYARLLLPIGKTTPDH